MVTVVVPTNLKSDEPRDRSLFEQVHEQVDLRSYLKPSLGDYDDHGNYLKARCLNPEHTDHQASMLVYHDQCRCQACGWKADIVDLHLMAHPELTATQAARSLLENDNLRFTGQVTEKVIRGLDQDLAPNYHLALAQNPDALAQLEAWSGFSREAIRHFRLGWARVLVRLQPEEVELMAAVGGPEEPGIEWRTINEKPVPFQFQWRYAVPVFSKGSLVQVIYRKANPADQGPKVTSERGAGVWLFNKDALRDAEMAVVSGGWGDSIALWHWQIVGVNSTGGDGHFAYDWVPWLGHVKRLYVVGDADAAGQRMMKRIQEHIPWAVPVELPWAAGSKKDIRDLLLAGWSREDFFRLLRQAEYKARWKALKR